MLTLYRAFRILDALRRVDLVHLWAKAVFVILGAKIDDEQLSPDRVTEAENLLRADLGEETLATLRRAVPENLVAMLRQLQGAGLTVEVESLTSAVVAGELAFSDELGAFGVLSQEQYQAREAARAVVLNTVRPWLDAYATSNPTCLPFLEQAVLHLARRGCTEPYLLLTYAIAMDAIQNGVKQYSVLSPSLEVVVAEAVCSLMGEKAPDQQVLSFAIPGLVFQITQGRTLLWTPRTDL